MPDRVRGRSSQDVQYYEEMFQALTSIDLYCCQMNSSYAVWGGLGAASYVGHLFRKTSDLDIVLPKCCHNDLSAWLQRAGYSIGRDKFSEVSNYTVLCKGQIKVQAFDEHFAVVNPECPEETSCFSFETALRFRERRTVRHLEYKLSADLYVLPIEYLVSTKLILPLRPEQTTDLLVLLSLCSHRERLVRAISEVAGSEWLWGNMQANIRLLDDIHSHLWWISRLGDTLLDNYKVLQDVFEHEEQE